MTTTELILQHKNFADTLAKNKKCQVGRPIYYDELQSAAYLGLVQAAQCFDQENGASFTSFAYLRIKGSMEDYLRELGRPRRGQLSPGKPCCEQDPGYCHKWDDETILELVKMLPPQGRRLILMRYRDGLGDAEIARRANISIASVGVLLYHYLALLRRRWQGHREEFYER